LLDKHLNIKKIKQNHNEDMLYKIALINLLSYKNNFAKSLKKIDVKKFDQYLKDVAKYLNKLYIKEKIEAQDILNLHYAIMNKLTIIRIDKAFI